MSTFEVPASKASKDQDKFKFKIGAKTFAIKRAKFLTVGDAARLENPETSEVVLDFFGEAGTPQGDAIRGLDKEQWNALFEAWIADSQVSPGESSASTS